MKRKREKERERESRASARVLVRYGRLTGLFSALGSVAGPCPPLVLVLAAPLNSVAGLCGPALCPGLVLLLSLSWPRPRTLWPVSVARLTGKECGRTNSDVNADKNSLMKQFALGVKVGRTKKSIFD